MHFRRKTASARWKTEVHVGRHPIWDFILLETWASCKGSILNGLCAFICQSCDYALYCCSCGLLLVLAAMHEVGRDQSIGEESPDNESMLNN